MYSRTELVIGATAVEKLRSSRVCVVGLGGVGGYIAEALARAGVGKLGLCDFDRVDVSNKNRQILALDSTLGIRKTEAAAVRIHDINSECDVTVFLERINADNAELLFSRNRWDYVADAIDDVPAKIAIIEYCVLNQIPEISCMGTGNKLDPMQFRISDISKTEICPLARKVRQELRRDGIEKGVKVLFSTEKPVSVPAGSPVGSVSFVPSIAGLLIGGEIIKDLTGAGKMIE